MRWESLFADLAAQMDAAEAAELAADADEHLRHEVGRRTLVERLLAAQDTPLRLGLADGDLVAGSLALCGPDWLLLAPMPGSRASAASGELLVPLAAVTWFEGLGRAAEVADPGQVWRRTGLRLVLRGLVRERAAVQVRVAGALPMTGTLDRVAADHVELALHPADEPRRAAAVRALRVLPLAAVIAVRRLT